MCWSMLKFPFDMNLTLEFGGFNNNDITERIPKWEKLENCNVKKNNIVPVSFKNNIFKI